MGVQSCQFGPHFFVLKLHGNLFVFHFSNLLRIICASRLAFQLKFIDFWGHYQDCRPRRFLGGSGHAALTEHRFVKFNRIAGRLHHSECRATPRHKLLLRLKIRGKRTPCLYHNPGRHWRINIWRWDAALRLDASNRFLEKEYRFPPRLLLELAEFILILYKPFSWRWTERGTSPNFNQLNLSRLGPDTASLLQFSRTLMRREGHVIIAERLGTRAQNRRLLGSWFSQIWGHFKSRSALRAIGSSKWWKSWRPFSRRSVNNRFRNIHSSPHDHRKALLEQSQFAPHFMLSLDRHILHSTSNFRKIWANCLKEALFAQSEQIRAFFGRRSSHTLSVVKNLNFSKIAPNRPYHKHKSTFRAKRYPPSLYKIYLVGVITQHIYILSLGNIMWLQQRHDSCQEAFILSLLREEINSSDWASVYSQGDLRFQIRRHIVKESMHIDPF